MNTQGGVDGLSCAFSGCLLRSVTSLLLFRLSLSSTNTTISRQGGSQSVANVAPVLPKHLHFELSAFVLLTQNEFNRTEGTLGCKRYNYYIYKCQSRLVSL